jgi:hypothetical protein
MLTHSKTNKSVIVLLYRGEMDGRVIIQDNQNKVEGGLNSIISN